MNKLHIASISALTLSLATQGCMLSGERALHGCPSDEMCSDLTPDGLEFSGRHVGEQGQTSLALAVGGTERVHVQVQGGNAPPAFDAVVRDAAFATAMPAGSDEVLLTGVAEGQTMLRIVEEGSDLLFDRVGLRVAPIDGVRLVPSDSALVHPTYVADHEWAFLTGAEVSAEVRLEDAAGQRLIDESLIVGSGTPLVVDDSAYDWVTAPAQDTAQTLDLEITAGGTRHTTPFVVVSEADLDGIDVVAIEGLDTHVGDAIFVCAYATAGELSVAGGEVAFSVEGSALALTAPDPENVGWCTRLMGQSAGTATVVATLGDVTGRLTLDVLPSDAATSPLTAPGAEPAAEETIRGERGR